MYKSNNSRKKPEKKKTNPKILYVDVLYIKEVCNILASAGRIVNSKREKFTIGWDVLDLTVNLVPGGSVVHNRVKTITISDSNQAHVQHSQWSTHRHNIQTDTSKTNTTELFRSHATETSWASWLHTWTWACCVLYISRQCSCRNLVGSILTFIMTQLVCFLFFVFCFFVSP